MNSTFDLASLVRAVLREHAFENSGFLAPTRLDTLGFQLVQLFDNPKSIDPKLLGKAFYKQGLSLNSLQAVLNVVQHAYIAENNINKALHISQLMLTLIESFIAEQSKQSVAEQDHLVSIINKTKSDEQQS